MTAAAIPFGREYGHYSGVDPLIIPVQRVTQYALGDKADLLVDVPCARIEGVDLQRDAVQAQLLDP